MTWVLVVVSGGTTTKVQVGTLPHSVYVPGVG